MAIPAQRTNTWTLDEWYDQAVAGTQGTYIGAKELWIWGRGNQGALGLNQPSNTNVSSPTQISGTTWSTPIIAGCGNGHMHSALKTDGTLWSWGYNEKGALGQNSTTAYSSPVQIGTETTWAGGALGVSNQFIVKTDGTLWTWGQNARGQLMQNDLPNKSSPKQVGTDTTWSGALGKIAVSSSPTSQVTLIKTDGTMWAAGRQDDYKELGTTPANTQYSSPAQIPGTWSKCARGASFGMAIKGNGTLWMWGNNQSGRLGQNNINDGYSSPVQVGTDTTWSDIEGNSGNAFGIKTDGTLWVWGNSGGNNGLNLGHTTGARSSPTQIGTDTTWNFLCKGGVANMAAIKTDGTLWVWGQDEYGQMGENNADIDRSSPTQVPGTTWTQISSNTSGYFGIKNI